MEHISIEFPGVKALDDVDFEIKSGEIRGLAGANGAGKSTLMKILSGVNTHYEGSIFINGTEKRISSPRDAKQCGIEIVYQEVDAALVHNVSVAENIMLNHLVNKMDRKAFVDWKMIRREAAAVLKKLNVDLDVNQPVSELTLSEKQMVLIARAVSEQCSFLILDEPTAPLSHKETVELFRIVKELSEKDDIGVIFISHRLPEILELCTSLTVMRDGKVAGNVALDGSVTPEKIVEMMLGRSMEVQHFNERPHTIGEVVLQVQGLCDKGNSVHEVSFDLHKGEIIGLAGLVGAGKTELCKTLFGEFAKTAGRIYLHGKEVRISSPAKAVRAGIAFVAEERRKESVLLNDPIYTNLSLTNLNKFVRVQPFVRKSAERASAKQIMADLKIKAPNENQQVEFLSGGNQQKVAVGKWFVSNAGIYIFDEPTKGVDVAAKQEIYQLIIRLVEEGNAVIYATCEFPEILSITDRTLVMYSGRIVKELQTKDTNEKELLYYSTGGR